MRHYSEYHISYADIINSDLGDTKITMYRECGAYHLKSTNVLGLGLTWEVIKTQKEAMKKFRALKKIQEGNYALKNYSISIELS